MKISLQQAWATYQTTVVQNDWIPKLPTQLPDGSTHYGPHPRQQQFLLHAHTMEVFYGGSAGGGKTFSTLAAAAQFVDVPGYSALLLRENFADLNQPGSWIPLSRSWWHSKADYNATERRWTFPSGATITFGYLSNDAAAYQYDTAEYQCVCIDELTQHTEWRYKFLFGRLRRPSGGPLAQVPLRMRSASNPGNKGHEWVRRRFIDPHTREPGAVFIPARIEDNPSLDAKAYREGTLAKLDPVTRRQRELGDWDAVEEGRFKREHLARCRYRVVAQGFGQGGEYDLHGKRYLRQDCWRYMTVDPAATAEQISKGTKSGDPDYTVISLWDVTHDGHLVWADCHRFRAEIPDIVPQIEQMYVTHRPHFVAIEAVASNRAVLQEAQRRPMAVREVSPRGADKLTRASGAITLSAAGKLWLPEKAHWLAEVELELLLFRGDGKTHDDVVDTLSYAVALLDESAHGGTGARPTAFGGRRW